jgi:hypothetical protein
MPFSITLIIIHPRGLLRLGLLSVLKNEAGVKAVAPGYSATATPVIIDR